MRAALAARDDPSFFIVARTSAVGVTGLEDAVARTRAYTASGADALFYTGIKDRAELDAIFAVATKPIILGGADGPELSDRGFLAARGVRIALQGHQPIMAAQRAVYETLKALRDGTRAEAAAGPARQGADARASPARRLQALDQGLPGRRVTEGNYHEQRTRKPLPHAA